MASGSNTWQKKSMARMKRQAMRELFGAGGRWRDPKPVKPLSWNDGVARDIAARRSARKALRVT
jgi:hypothetical protein